MLTSPATAAAAAALAMENNRSTASATSGPETGRDTEADHSGGTGDRLRPSGSEGNGGREREGSSLAAAEFAGWGGAGGAGWGHWSHVDMQLVVGQASKHRVSEDSGTRSGCVLYCFFVKFFLKKKGVGLAWRISFPLFYGIGIGIYFSIYFELFLDRICGLCLKYARACVHTRIGGFYPCLYTLLKFRKISLYKI